MRLSQTTRIIPMLALISLTLGLAPALSTAANEEPMRMRAQGGHRSSGFTSIVEVSVDSWSTEAEHEAILRAAAESASVPRGDRSLRNALQASDSHGRISLQGNLGIEVRYAYQFEQDGGRTIILAADRAIGAFEASEQGSISLDYDVTLAVIELDEQGRGEGDLWAAASIRVDDDGRFRAIGIDVDPIHLGRVRVLR